MRGGELVALQAYGDCLDKENDWMKHLTQKSERKT